MRSAHARVNTVKTVTCRDPINCAVRSSRVLVSVFFFFLVLFYFFCTSYLIKFKLYSDN